MEVFTFITIYWCVAISICSFKKCLLYIFWSFCPRIKKIIAYTLLFSVNVYQTECNRNEKKRTHLLLFFHVYSNLLSCILLSFCKFVRL